MEIQTLKADLREQSGSARARKLRGEGLVPGVLYGHGQEVVKVTLAGEQVHELLTGGHRLLQLDLGQRREHALIKEVQWDTWGRAILHIDFARVALDETVRVSVPVVGHGTPRAVVAGGVFEQPLHAIEVECRVDAIPDDIRIEITPLEIGGMIHVKDLALPPGAKAVADPEAIVFIAHEARKEEVVAPAAAEAAPAEPEVIARGKEETEEEAEEPEGKAKA